MIADDMMTFIKKDILTFGIGVLIFIIITLWYVFRKVVWLFIPLSSCMYAVIIMVGLLGFIGWKVTVISSNFIALMLILTMAMNIHMSTRFLQLKRLHPNFSKSKILILTTNKMFLPILYTVLTTICAFLSLIFSEIKPVIDFGWMMTLGLIVSMLTVFTLLPCLLSFLNEKYIFNLENQKDSKFTNFLAEKTLKHKNLIIFSTIIIIFLSVFGIANLKVHSKLCLITRREDGQRVRYAHIGTGNFNEKLPKRIQILVY